MRIAVTNDLLKAVSSDGTQRDFAFPAAAISINGKRIEVRTPIVPAQQLSDGSWTAEFRDGSCLFKVTVFSGPGDWFFKQLEVTALEELPTPDYLEVDNQTVFAPQLESCGYRSTISKTIKSGSAEEGRGIIPGCGYPLIGKDLFTGLEHAAAFNTLTTENNDFSSWQLRHHPTWKDNKITSCCAVTGFGKEPRELFFDYLETRRIECLKSPLIAFCSFWSDPYEGNLEYKVSGENYPSLLNAFHKLGLTPDVYTLDAGWQERKSFLRAKESYGGEEALIRFAETFRKYGSDISLWVTANGNIGISTDFMREQGIATGSGNSSHYSGDNFGVLLDRNLEKVLTERAMQLASPPYKVRHFKIDWDNECATTPDFDKIYPTRNHVREESINVMTRINQALRKINPGILTRNGYWPSPWQALRTTHIFLSDSGDCDYGESPALSQRDAAINNRDMLYWCSFVRDKSICPLDMIDNHEFSGSLRNPFGDSPASWSNTCVWALMRGNSYHQLALMPENLEDWQVKILARTFEVIRKHPQKIITGRSEMFGQNPLKQGIYGFRHPGKDGSVLIGLRNSSPMPQEYILPDFAPFYEQIYPDCRPFCAGEKIIFAPHEVKVLSGSPGKQERNLPYPCQLFPQSGNCYACYLPSSAKPDVLSIHQIPELKMVFSKEQTSENGSDFNFGLKVPWRMRQFKVFFKISGKAFHDVKVRISTSRYAACTSSAYAVPVTEVSFGNLSSGEWKNPDTTPIRDARYFTAALPRGGDVYFRVYFEGSIIRREDLELWVSGYEAPARTPENDLFTPSEEVILPLPHPEGFPLSLRLI